MQHLLSPLRAAIQDYNMISEGDKIAVGISGGKDSLALLVLLANLQKFYPVHFDIIAITLDMQIENVPTDYSEIEKLCDSLNIKYIIKRTSLYDVIFNIRKEKNPCSLCSKMRRGILHDVCTEAGCNKIALGHHMDDAAETFIMNLFRGGSISSFSPVSYLSRKNLYMIRPMIYLRESEISAFADKFNLPVIESKCPMDKHSERQSTKELISSLEKDYPGLTGKIITAMKNKQIDNW